MLSIPDILKKVHGLEIKSKKLANDLFSGEYHSAFKGKGMLFKEVKEYTAGDDVRFIDWNVSARFGQTYSKVFEEERELSVMLLIDTSASTLFGSSAERKMDVATEIAAVIGFAAINNGDKVGAIFYDSEVNAFLPAKKGRQQVLHILRKMLSENPLQKATSLADALKFFNNTSRKKSIAFILSDFLDDNYAEGLRIAAKKNDVVGIKIYDPLDKNLPNAGLFLAEDLETGETHWVDTDNAYVKAKYEEAFFKNTEKTVDIFAKAGASLLHCQTDEDYVRILKRFFSSRHT